MTPPENETDKPSLRCYRVDSPRELDDLFRLRYQVYCLERGFLRQEDYPNQRETDEFDAHSTHFVVRGSAGRAFATTRLVRNSSLGLPIEKYFDLDSVFDGLDRNRLAEASRFAVSKELRHQGPAGETSPSEPSKQGQRREAAEISLGLMKSLFWECQRQGVTHLCAAIERPLWRMLRHVGFAMRQIGPPKDYFGLCIPCLMSEAELKEFIQRFRPELLDIFWWPQASAHPDSQSRG